ncbi:MAG TPA: carboxypeptidase regulatory-like domain-containing protein, partial [Bryobacteraceae bacterium]|nr:carboxypeptidase regulatory-like domain-containing protein [Bryobacteraceae bacterium]
MSSASKARMAAAVLAALAFTLKAQDPAGLSMVSGVVLDSSEAAIEGAQVTVRGAGWELPRSTITDQTGAFRVESLTPGSYEVRVTHSGFQEAKARVKAGPRAPGRVRIVLSIARLREEITVDGGAGQINTEVGENLDVVRLDRGALDSLPILGADVMGAISRLVGPGGPLTLVVDGMVSSGLGVPASAIQEIRVNQNPYSAEFSSPGQSRVEIITKTGSSQYHGSLKMDLRDYRLDARNAFAVDRPPEQHRLVDGSFSGPLGKGKKTTFLLSAYREDDDQQAVVYAQTASGPVRLNFARPLRSTLASARVNRQIGKSNTLSVRYNFFDWSDKGEGVGGYGLPEGAVDSASRQSQIIVTDRAVITTHMFNAVSLRIGTQDTSTRSRLQGVPRIVVLDAFAGGGAQQDVNDGRTSFQFSDALSFSHGKHLLKTGFEVPDFTRRSLNDQGNATGTFQFSSLADYVAQTPFSFSRRQGDGRLALEQGKVALFVQDDIRLRPNLSLGVGLRYEWQSHVDDLNNLAPRLSFAFSPGKRHKMALRGGVGIFYESVRGDAIADTLRFDGLKLRQILLSNPGYPDPFSGGAIAALQPSSLVRFAPDLRSPYRVQYSIGVEKELRKAMTMTVTYIGVRGVKLFRSRDVNAAFFPPYRQRPDSSIGMLRQIESSGHLESHSVKVALGGSFTRFFEGKVQYATGRAYDDTSGMNSFPANQYDLSGEWSRAGNDVRHFFYVYG